MNLEFVNSSRDAMWTLDSALPVLRALEAVASKEGFHVALSGSVLYRGHSAKDLDVVVYPHNVNLYRAKDRARLLQSFQAAGFSDPYGVSPSCNDKDVVVVKNGGKRIDLFFLR